MPRLPRLAALLLAALPAAAEDPPLLGLWLMGQSLCDGSESLPLVTPEDTGWGNLAFQRGVRTWLPQDHPAAPQLRPQQDFTFVPLHARVNGGLGETVANGLADHLRAALLGPEKKTAPRFLVACAGQGGRQIQELAPADLSTDLRTPASRRHGGGYYRTSLDDAARARDQARALGLSFRLHALYWMQGEGNGGPSGGIMPNRWDPELPRAQGLAWYRDQLIAFRRQWSDDLRAVTGQADELDLFTYQTLGPAGDAQLMAADADPRIHLVGPHYAVPSALNSRCPPGRHGDPIHLSADGERWWGEQVGKVMHRVLHLRQPWQPLRPRHARLNTARDSVLVEFTVPHPPLVLDTQFLPRQEIPAPGGGFTSLAGFQVRGPSGQPHALTAIEPASPVSIRLRLSAPLPAEETCQISYGHPFTTPLGAIAAIRQTEDGGEEIVLAASFAAALKNLAAEGAFLVTSTTGPAARVPVRQVREENGVSLLRYDPAERRNAAPFAVGQSLTAQRAFSYGNLRDSDPAPSVHRFADPAYGTRAGQPYPLWNWCVLFSNLPAR